MTACSLPTASVQTSGSTDLKNKKMKNRIVVGSKKLKKPQLVKSILFVLT